LENGVGMGGWRAWFGRKTKIVFLTKILFEYSGSITVINYDILH
jgi:hypothetical protein